jgi:hypothetical protein
VFQEDVTEVNSVLSGETLEVVAVPPRTFAGRMRQFLGMVLEILLHLRVFVFLRRRQDGRDFLICRFFFRARFPRVLLPQNILRVDVIPKHGLKLRLLFQRQIQRFGERLKHVLAAFFGRVPDDVRKHGQRETEEEGEGAKNEGACFHNAILRNFLSPGHHVRHEGFDIALKLRIVGGRGGFKGGAHRVAFRRIFDEASDTCGAILPRRVLQREIVLGITGVIAFPMGKRIHRRIQRAGNKLRLLPSDRPGIVADAAAPLICYRLRKAFVQPHRNGARSLQTDDIGEHNVRHFVREQKRNILTRLLHVARDINRQLVNPVSVDFSPAGRSFQTMIKRFFRDHADNDD